MSIKIKALGRATVTLTTGQALIFDGNAGGQVWLQNQPVNKAPSLSLVATNPPGFFPTVYTPSSYPATLLMVNGNDDGYYEIGTAPAIKQLQNDNGFLPSGSPNAVNATATLTVAQLLGIIITSTSAAAVVATLPTGTQMDAGSSWVVGEFVDINVINTGPSSWTLTAAAGFTIVGVAAVATTSFGIFRLVKSAANTFVAYRIG